MVEWYNQRLPYAGPGFDSRSIQLSEVRIFFFGIFLIFFRIDLRSLFFALGHAHQVNDENKVQASKQVKLK